MTCNCGPDYCALCGTWPAQMTPNGTRRCSKCETRAVLMERINAYLISGGLFNPEMAEHDKVRDLIMDCREALLR
jgi:hypothetical protein